LTRRERGLFVVYLKVEEIEKCSDFQEFCLGND
jgi:hypothetical protein